VGFSLLAHSLFMLALGLSSSSEKARPDSIEVIIDLAEEGIEGVAAPLVRLPSRKETSISQNAEKKSQEMADPNGAQTLAVESNSSNAQSATQSSALSSQELDASERYTQELRQLLDRRKTYPAPARRLGKQGRVVVRFTLKRDGTVIKADILNGSSHEILNEAARELVRAVNGFRPFPMEITKAHWDFLVPIDYMLN
jgi:protein TonB